MTNRRNIWNTWHRNKNCENVNYVGAHMLIYIYAQSQSKYILVFSLILFLYYFHFTVCTPFQFFPNFSLFYLPFYSLQKPVTLTQHCWFCFHLSACVPTRCVESNCIICNTRAHLGALSRVEAGGRNGVYVGWDTRLHFPPQCSDSHWGGENHCFSSFIVLINCIIVSVRYYQCISVLTVTEEFLLAKSSKFLIPTAPILTL